MIFRSPAWSAGPSSLNIFGVSIRPLLHSLPSFCSFFDTFHVGFFYVYQFGLSCFILFAGSLQVYGHAGTRWIYHHSGSHGCGSLRSSSGSSSGWLVPGCCSGRYALRQDASCLLAGKLCRGLGGVPSRTSQAGWHLSMLRCTGFRHQGWSTVSHPQALGSVPSHISAGKAPQHAVVYRFPASRMEH